MSGSFLPSSTPNDNPPEQTDDLPLTGTWEQKGRTPPTAAILGLLIVGAIYFNGLSILVFIGVIIRMLARGEMEEPTTLPEAFGLQVELFTDPLRVSLVIAQFGLMLPITLWLVRRWHTPAVWRYLRLHWCGPAPLFLAAVATLGFLPVNMAIAHKFLEWIHFPQFLYTIQAQVFTAESPNEFLWLIFVIAVTPAICEEIFFRGYAQRTFERTLGWKSVVLVGVIFGLFHMQPLGLISLSLLGVLFGYLYYRSRSLLPGMVAHFTNNFMVIYLYYRKAPLSGVSVEYGDSVPLLWVGMGFMLAAFALVVFHQINRRKSGNEEA